LLKLLEQHKLTSPEVAANLKDLKTHLDDYRRSMEAENRSPEHVKWTISQIRKVMDGCGFTRWADVDAHKVKIFLSSLRTSGRKIKTRSFNGYVVACQSFANWAVKNGRIPYSPLVTISKLTITDEEQRRGLTVDELRLLLQVSRDAPHRFGMSGADRAMLYRVAAETGLRA
jgi:site-specific recombinase XerC